MSEEANRLYRSRDDRMLAGVCGGLGDYLRTDPTVVRVLFAILTLITIGGGILLYLAMWLIIPEEPLETKATTPSPPVEETAPEPPAEESAEQSTTE